MNAVLHFFCVNLSSTHVHNSLYRTFILVKRSVSFTATIISYMLIHIKYTEEVITDGSDGESVDVNG